MPWFAEELPEAVEGGSRAAVVCGGRGKEGKIGLVFGIRVKIRRYYIEGILGLGL